MKKNIFLLCFVIFSFSISSAFANTANPESNMDNTARPVNHENALSENEINRLTKRVEEINNMDKSDLTWNEKRVLKKELRTIKKNIRQGYSVVYIGTGTLILIVILIIILI